MPLSEIEYAERSSRARAAIMALLAAVTAFNSTLGLQSPVNDAASFRGGAWLLTVALGLVILSTGGGLMLSRRLRELMNDERTRHNRSRAFAAGFFVAMVTALALYALSWSIPVELRAGLRLVTGLGLAAALARYALLEWL